MFDDSGWLRLWAPILAGVAGYLIWKLPTWISRGCAAYRTRAAIRRAARDDSWATTHAQSRGVETFDDLNELLAALRDEAPSRADAPAAGATDDRPGSGLIPQLDSNGLVHVNGVEYTPSGSVRIHAGNGVEVEQQGGLLRITAADTRGQPNQNGDVLPVEAVRPGTPLRDARGRFIGVATSAPDSQGRLTMYGPGTAYELSADVQALREIAAAGGTTGFHGSSAEQQINRAYQMPGIRLPNPYKAAFSSEELFQQQADMRTHDHGLQVVLDVINYVVDRLAYPPGQIGLPFRDYKFSINFASTASTDQKRFVVKMRVPIEGDLELFQRMEPGSLHPRWHVRYNGQDVTSFAQDVAQPVEEAVGTVEVVRPRPIREQRSIMLDD